MEGFAWEVANSEIAYSCPGFDVVHQNVRLPDGTETAFDYVDEPPSVVILPLTPDDDVVTIREWRQAVRRVNRGLPAGAVEPTDVDLTAAARRELREETGYDAARIDPLLVAEPANGTAASVFHYFLARGCEPGTDQALDRDETIVTERVPYDAFRRTALAGELRDGRSLLGILFYEATRE